MVRGLWRAGDAHPSGSPPEHLRQGHRVSLLCPPGSPLLKTAEKQGIEVDPSEDQTHL